MKKILTIAGSDCSGGAGIQADLKTITCHGMYGMSAITALTAQNTTGVYGIQESTPEFLTSQLDCIFQDIFPDAVKIGMVSSPELIEVIADRLSLYKPAHIVLDPVMVATSGGRLMKDDAYEILLKKLFPLASVITPNIPEAELLAKCKITDETEMKAAAEAISSCYEGNILIKGGHLESDANDILFTGSDFHLFYGAHIPTENTHGTGCTLSSAIACNLAAGHSITDSIRHSKTYITEAMLARLDLGKGNGPLMHNYMIHQ